MTMQEDDVTVVGNAVVDLTGFGLTMQEGSLKTVIWNPVNTGSTSTWTEVNQGSTSGGQKLTLLHKFNNMN
jgi:hypothetical protein